MKPHFSTHISALAACALIAGCAGDSDKYPSLAIRDVERAHGQFTPVEPTDPEPIRPVATDAEISTLVETARASHSRFIEAQPGVSRLVSAAAGSGIESNARQRALVALADLTSLHSDTEIPMGDLDELEVEAATTFAPTAEIEQARATVLTLLDEQDRTLDALYGELAL